MRGEGRDILGPSAGFRDRHVRLGDVIQDSAQVRHGGEGLKQGGQVGWARQDVERHVAARDFGECGAEARIEDQRRRVFLQHRTQADPFRLGAVVGEASREIRRQHVRPADDAGHERRALGDRQQVVGLGLGLGGLDQDGAGDAGRLHGRGEIVGAEITIEGDEVRGHPAVVAAFNRPEMLMAVEQEVCSRRRPGVPP